jgi:hypothetical protein
MTNEQNQEQSGTHNFDLSSNKHRWKYKKNHFNTNLHIREEKGQLYPLLIVLPIWSDFETEVKKSGM